MMVLHTKVLATSVMLSVVPPPHQKKACCPVQVHPLHPILAMGLPSDPAFSSCPVSTQNKPVALAGLSPVKLEV